MLLRDSDTGKFYHQPGGWVADWNEATDFEVPLRALEERKRVARENMELLVADDTGRAVCEVRLWKDCSGGS
jgi:hypothetical protein